MQPPTRGHEPHNLALDSVRGIAALWVVAYHVATSRALQETFDGALGGAFGEGAGPRPGLGAAALVRDGWLLVDLFFVLSGLVMAMTYVRAGAAFSARDFAVRRIARLYPLHLAVLLAWIPVRAVRLLAGSAGLAGGAVLAHDVNTPYAFAVQLVLLNAFGTLDAMSWNGPSWSISAEVGAYAAFAAIVASLPGRAAAVARAFALVAMLALAAALLVLREDGLDFNLRFGVVRCLYGFGLGVVALRGAAVLRARRVAMPGTVQVALALVGLAAVAAVGAQPWVAFAAPPLFALLLGSLVVSPDTIVGRALSVRPLVWLGRRSYSIYMVHALVVILAEYACRGAGLDRVRALDASLHGALGLCAIPLILAMVVAVSDVTYRRIEIPGGRVVRRLLGRPGRPAPAGRLGWRDGR